MECAARWREVFDAGFWRIGDTKEDEKESVVGVRVERM